MPPIESLQAIPKIKARPRIQRPTTRNSRFRVSSSLPGLYVHVPFCLSKCVYCDFYSIEETTSIPRWVDAIEQEMSLYEKIFPRFDTLFIGGGTPSLLGQIDLDALFVAIRNHFAFATDTEITVEINPDDADEGLLVTLRSLGVNRLSFGIQSFIDDELGFLGRRHTAAQAVGAIRAAGDAGFSNIALDLIYGLPSQSEERWLSSLEKAVSFRPNHISCYQLTTEDHTPLTAMMKTRGLTLPSDEVSRSLFLLTSRFLQSHGFIHYEVSNFTQAPSFVCQHNAKYWDHTPYLGLGPAAHSFDGINRWWNHRSLDKYCSAVISGKAPVDGRETLSCDQLQLERIYLGLRTGNGIDLGELSPNVLPFVDELKDHGLARVNANRMTLTAEGYLIADSLPAHLVP
jgi:oxygen-independent coproporphyrinogen III oxidase